MFQKRLQEILTLLDLSGASLAKYSGLNQSTISKYKNGSRTPDASSPSMHNLVEGICRYAEVVSKAASLQTFLSITEEEAIPDALHSYLFDLKATTNDSESRSIDQSLIRAFGNRLDSVMTLLDITNIRLSHLMNVDASLISRYRTGARYPKENSSIHSYLSKILYERIIQQNMEAAFSEISGIQADLLSPETFAEWLFLTKDTNLLLIQSAKQILFALDSFTDVKAGDITSVPEMLKNLSIPESPMYLGSAGLRSASIRFLKAACLSDSRDIWVYSDSTTDWMNEDKHFLQLWALMMAQCIRKGIHIHIVHSLNRNIEEMLPAIQNWLPLYMSGMLDSYYCSANNVKSFSHTIFFCPDAACISGMSVKGAEEHAIFHYCAKPDLLSHYQNSFRTFMKDTRPLIKVYKDAPVNMEMNNRIITPDSIYIRDSQDDSGPQRIPLKNSPFKNVKISIGDKYVGVTRIPEPTMTFFFTHPMLCNAFEILSEKLLEETKR